MSHLSRLKAKIWLKKDRSKAESRAGIPDRNINGSSSPSSAPSVVQNDHPRSESTLQHQVTVHDAHNSDINLQSSFSTPAASSVHSQSAQPPSPPEIAQGTTLEPPTTKPAEPLAVPPIRTDLWHLAIEKLEKEERGKLFIGEQDNRNEPGPPENLLARHQIKAILELVDSASKEEENKQWKTNINKLVDGTMKFKSLIDAGLQFDPTKYGALAWGVVSFGLQITLNAKEMRDLVFASSEYLANIMARYASYEVLYYVEVQAEQSAAYRRFEEGIVDVYASIFRFVGEMNHYLREYGIVHAGKAFLPTTERTLNTKKKEIEEKDVEFRNRLEVLRDECISEQFRGLQDQIQDLFKPTYNLSKRLESIERFTKRVEQDQILNWLPQAHMYLTHIEIRNKVGIENPGKWILQEEDFLTWQNSKTSWGIWLCGQLGTGKTVLTSTVIDHMATLYGRTSQGALAFYYCSGATNTRNTAADVLGSILRQLAETDEGLNIFEKWRSSHTRLHLTHNAMVDLICSLIELNGNATTTIIIDALDELESDNFDIVTDALETMLDQSRGLLKVFVSSRPDPRAWRVLENWLKITINPRATRHDIDAYIDYQVEKRLQRKRRVMPS